MTDHSVPSPERLTANEVAQALKDGKLTVVELAQACLARIGARPEVKAWAYIDHEQVLKEAERLDAIPKADRSPLWGLPIGVKDIFQTTDMPTKYGSKRYEGHQSTEDARIVKLLRAKGCLIFGKTHTTEFACGGAGDVHPPTRNPHDPRRVPGASSAGSAASVADFQIPIAIGTQTGGSIIGPASFCGTYAWKPTFNIFSLYGTFSISPSCDTLGIFARSAQDLSFFADQLLPLDKSVSNVVQCKPRIAWTPAPIDEQPDAGALRAIEAAVKALKESGFNVEKVALPRVFGQSHLTARKVMYKEIAGSLQAELSEGEEGIYRTELILAQKGSEISWNEYVEAQTEIGKVRCSFAETMAGYDAFLTLSQAEEAPISEGVAGQLIFNIPWSAIGVPVVNVPGWSGDSSMPIGMSLIGRHYEDGALLKLAQLVGDVFERKGNWKSRV